MKNPPPSTGEPGLFPGSRSSPGIGIGNPLQYSCLENSVDRGAWRAAVQRVVKNQTPLSRHRQLLAVRQQCWTAGISKALRV